MKYTIKDLRRDFSDDDTCLDYIFRTGHGDRFKCPSCKKEGHYYRVKKRKCYACSFCGHQIYPTANTIFHKSSTDLTLWFYAIFLMSQTKTGVSAKTLERQLGVTYKCAYRMNKKIKELIEQGPFVFNYEKTGYEILGKEPPSKKRNPEK